METLELEEIRNLVDARIKFFGSKAAYARHLGIRPQQLQRSLGVGVTPDATVLADIGLTKKTVFCKKDDDWRKRSTKTEDGYNG